MKWIVVALVLGYVALRVYVAVKRDSAIAKICRRKVLLRTDIDTMSRRQMVLSSLSFLVFGLAGVGLFIALERAAARHQWAVFDARPVVVLGKAGLFVGGLALAISVFLVGAALLRRG